MFAYCTNSVKPRQPLTDSRVFSGIIRLKGQTFSEGGGEVKRPSHQRSMSAMGAMLPRANISAIARMRVRKGRCNCARTKIGAIAPVSKNECNFGCAKIGAIAPVSKEGRDDDDDRRGRLTLFSPRDIDDIRESISNVRFLLRASRQRIE